jgi:hypothetical protein
MKWEVAGLAWGAQARAGLGWLSFHASNLHRLPEGILSLVHLPSSFKNQRIHACMVLVHSIAYTNHSLLKADGSVRPVALSSAVSGV